MLFAGAAVAAVVGFLFGWTQGKPLLEIPVPLDLVIVVAALMFIANVVLTIAKAKQRSLIQYMLAAGVIFLALLYLIGIPFFKNLNADYYYWWWVIHLWVEGAWELITASLVAFVILKTTGVDRKVVEKWLYVETGLFLFTGLVGTGHHYYWIGAPDYWLWWGGIFSALEPLPIALMVADTWLHVRERKDKTVNPLLWTYIVGMAIYHFFGAGVWGFFHTLPPINYYTHGSQITVSHGHMAFFGAYALVNLTIYYYALPQFKGIKRYKENARAVGLLEHVPLDVLPLPDLPDRGRAPDLPRALPRHRLHDRAQRDDVLVQDRARPRRLVPRRRGDDRLAPLHAAAGRGEAGVAAGARTLKGGAARSGRPAGARQADLSRREGRIQP